MDLTTPVDQVNGGTVARRCARLASLAAVLGTGLLVPAAFAPWREEVFAPIKVQVLLLLVGLSLMTIGAQLATGNIQVRWPATVDLAAAAFGMINLIAFTHSLDPAGSWWGRFPEYQGLVTTLAYLMVYMAARVAFLPALPALSARRSAPLDALFGVLSLTTALISGYAILQRLGLDPLWGFAERPFATLGHANNLAAMLVVGLPGCAAAALAARRLPIRAAAALAGTLAALALVASMSRGGWLAALVTGSIGLALSPRRTRRRVLVVASALLVALLVTLSMVPAGRGVLEQAGTRWAAVSRTDTGSTAKHLALAHVGVIVTMEHPWLGIGQDSFPLVAQRYANERLPLPQARLLSSRLSESPHNALLSISASTGILGLLLYLGFLGMVTRQLVAAHRSGHRQAAPLLAILIAYLVSSLFMTPEVSSTTWFWLTAGAACSAVPLERPPHPRRATGHQSCDDPRVTSFAATERAELVAALRAVPEDAATLCEGWTARDLAAHLVARERRPDSGPGLLVPALAAWTEHVRAGYARRPYSELIDLVASGPPWTSPFALPGVDAAVNLSEHLVHTEDVRRARAGWQPRPLTDDVQDAIWRLIRTRGRMLFRKAPTTVVLARPARGDAPAEQARVAGQGPEVVITGEPLELLLFAFGRRDHALVELNGPDEAVAAVRTMPLGV